MHLKQASRCSRCTLQGDTCSPRWWGPLNLRQSVSWLQKKLQWQQERVLWQKLRDTLVGSGHKGKGCEWWGWGWRVSCGGTRSEAEAASGVAVCSPGAGLIARQEAGEHSIWEHGLWSEAGLGLIHTLIPACYVNLGFNLSTERLSPLICKIII